jgi:4-hydroxythreonine-4-phosphate dehydrogenase
MTTKSRAPLAPIALTMGDPSGIGPEIIVKLAADPDRPAADLLVVGDVGVLRRTASALGVNIAIIPVTDPSQAAGCGARTLCVIQSGPELPADLPIGQIDARSGAAAFAYVQKAIDLALAGQVRAIVTAPLNKEAMYAAGVRYPGHTEILADRCGVTDFAMMLANDELRVVLVSIHLSLTDAIAAVTPQAESRAIQLAHRAGLAFGFAKPRVAVAGLNPHAGEGGMFGREDADIIAPAIAAARLEGIEASGPWPGDTVFMRARKGEFDVVVAQYHDQGLIPVKYLGVDNGVNATLGLPFVRTSVDHGTAFDIAGKGLADPASLAYALKQAIAMTGG